MKVEAVETRRIIVLDKAGGKYHRAIKLGEAVMGFGICDVEWENLVEVQQFDPPFSQLHVCLIREVSA